MSSLLVPYIHLWTPSNYCWSPTPRIPNMPPRSPMLPPSHPPLRTDLTTNLGKLLEAHRVCRFFPTTPTCRFPAPALRCLWPVPHCLILWICVNHWPPRVRSTSTPAPALFPECNMNSHFQSMLRSRKKIGHILFSFISMGDRALCIMWVSVSWIAQFAHFLSENTKLQLPTFVESTYLQLRWFPNFVSFSNRIQADYPLSFLLRWRQKTTSSIDFYSLFIVIANWDPQTLLSTSWQCTLLDLAASAIWNVDVSQRRTYCGKSRMWNNYKVSNGGGAGDAPLLAFSHSHPRKRRGSAFSGFKLHRLNTLQFGAFFFIL